MACLASQLCPPQCGPWQVRRWQAGDSLAELTALLRSAEAWVCGQGHRAMLLDTAMPAAALRQRYARAGYADIASVQWQGKAYRSVVMLKPLATPAPADTDAEHQAATVRALWASFQARDWAAARCMLADHATLHWPASGEHLLDADAIIRVNAAAIRAYRRDAAGPA